MPACPSLGFVVTVRLEPTAPDAELVAVVHALRAVLEKQGLIATGGRGARAARLVVEREGSQATDADCQLVIEWTRGLAGRATIDVSDLVDLGGEAE